MNTVLARRQRRRRLAGGRKPRGIGAARKVAIAIPIILFSTLLMIGTLGAVGAVTAYGYYSSGLKEPREALENLDFSQQTILYDRTGTIELARLGEQKRELVAFQDIPLEVLDATTAIEDKTFWENAGFDPAGIVAAGLDTLQGNERGASTITQQLVRARLLPESAFAGSVYERKIREIIQSARLTEEYQGRAGKEGIITAYLNQNFYGNQSYGVKAAAKSYFKKELKDLTLSEAALLAAIPQSPSRFDLVANAIDECTVEIGEDEECPSDKRRLLVPSDTEIVVRRNYVLDLMKSRSPLSGHRHTAQEYDAAKRDEVVLADQTVPRWRAPHFVWQVRRELGALYCPETPDHCEQVDTGGFRVITTLDIKMQATVEKWLKATAIAPNTKNTDARLKALKIPRGEWGWIKNLRTRNIHNAASAVVDYRTGQVLAYGGSADYYGRGTKKMQPKFDVLSDGWRQPGSAIKPVNYAIGIDDHTMTASTLFMDVVTNFSPKGQKAYTPTQADNLERGPVRLRSALQFSLNIPAIKAGIMNGLDHIFERSQDFGLRYMNGAIPVISMSIGTVEVHPIDLLGAYGAIANKGVLMPRRTIMTIKTDAGDQVWPDGDGKPKGTAVISPEAAYIVTDILLGNTNPKVNPYWAEWMITDGRTRRPAAYKTGTTNDNRDVHAYGYLAPPKDREAPALAVGVWMGNSNNQPNRGSLSLDSSAPLWSAILSEVSKGEPIANFPRPPKGVVTATVDAHTGLRPGPFTSRTIKELFIEGTVPKKSDNTRTAFDVDASSGLLWQEGCVGPRVTRGFVDFAWVEPDFPAWQRYTKNWTQRARRGSGVAGRAEGDADGLPVRRQLLPVRPILGWPVRTDEDLRDPATTA